MTMDEFKKRFLEPKFKKRNAKKWVNNKDAKAYFDWFKDEEAKDDFARANPVQVLSEREIEEEVQGANEDRFIQLPKKYLQQSSSDLEPGKVQDLNSFRIGNPDKSEIKLKIEIPASEHNPGGIYKINNCYYDSNGDFLYKAQSDNT